MVLIIRVNVSFVLILLCAGWYIQITDFIFQAIYIFEIILKVFALQRIIITNLWQLFDILWWLFHLIFKIEMNFDLHNISF